MRAALFRSGFGAESRWQRLARLHPSMALVGLLVALSACSLPRDTTSNTVSNGIHKIQHIVVIMQENRSFDSYFGTYPGADGIPMRNGMPAVCVPDPARGGCQRPYHDANDVNGGGPHGQVHAVADVDGGKMDGFI